ncbi:MAG TPA: hypothetical protein VG028_04310 [Terriglobia bacterium]|nr:hypothetical protein [Terriglobia bacterium]
MAVGWDAKGRHGIVTQKASCCDPTCRKFLPAFARGEFNLRGLQNRTLRDHLPEKTTGQMPRLLKSLRLHGFIKKVDHTYCEYLTHFGKEIITAALKLKVLVLIPQLAFSPAS